MALRGELKTMAAIRHAFLRSPRSAFRLLGKLPAALSGYIYSQQVQFSHEPSVQPAATNPLQEYFDARREGRGIWKWRHYFEIYHRHLAKFIGRPVHVVEVGVYSGGSLEMWRQYFGSSCRLYGVDIEASCKTYENDHTQVHIGDQEDREFWARFRQSVPLVDVLVDDGGHKPEQQIATFEEMMPHLRPGGVYICEDIHGAHNGFNAYAQGLTKTLNDMGGEPSSFQSWISSIHFYPYLVVIEKAERPVRQFSAPKHGTEWQPWSTSRPRSAGRSGVS